MLSEMAHRTYPMYLRKRCPSLYGGASETTKSASCESGEKLLTAPSDFAVWEGNHTGENTGDSGQQTAYIESNRKGCETCIKHRVHSTPDTTAATSRNWLPGNC